MGFLGLDQTEVKDDNLFQRMFWPSDNAGETDTLCKQGFWVCWISGIWSFGVLALQGHPIYGLLTAVFFCLGGIGVREHSQPSAILVAAAYLLDIAAGLAAGNPPGAITLIFALLLVANIRSTFIAAKWAATNDPGTMPERLGYTFSDKLADRMPPVVWPKAKVLFFGIGGLYLMFNMLAVVLLALHIPQKMKARQQPEPPSATLEVTPSR